MNTPYQTTSIWEQADNAADRIPVPLNRDAIVMAAVKLADAHGIESVSIRKVAAELGVGPMRLYGHVSTKDDLLDLMVDVAYGEIAGSVAGEGSARTIDWRAQLHGVARSFRETALAHEWFIDLLGGRPHLGPNALVVLEATAAAINGNAKDNSIETVWYALSMVNAYMIGSIRADVVERRIARSSGQDDDAWQADVAPYLERMFSSGHFPTLRQMAYQVAQADAEAEFAWGLDAVLNGIALS